ncbi:MAG TPA: zf-HC2 domain-containing protein [Ktedonobacterales bacterium]|nr:zf-HC2 domain-containing protein [Ktedonobacterales bacterium]
MNTSNPRHLSGQPSGPECARYAALLPQFRQGTLSPAEDTALRAHLATCAHCPAQLAIYDTLDAALRTYCEHFAPTVPSADDLVRTAIARVSAASSAAALNHHQARALGTRQQDTQKDTAMPDTRPETAVQPPPPPTPASGRPLRNRRQHPVLATIAALLLIGMAAAIFAVFARTNSGPAHSGTPTATATATATTAPQPLAPLRLPKGATLMGFSMDSPEDGWAAGMTANREVIFLHYRGGQWSIWPSPAPSLMLVLGSHNISMDSPTDGWIAGVGGMLHYTNNQWVVVSMPGVGAINRVQMVSATDGWALGFIQSADRQTVNDGLLHFSDGKWSVVTLPAALRNIQGPSRLDFSVTPSGECWLMYYDASSGSTQIFRPTGGSFQVAYTLAHTQGQGLTMHSPRDGWLTGSDATGNTSYHFDGSTWTKVQVPADFPRQSLLLDPVVTSPSGEAWLLANSDTDRQKAYAARYRNGSWETIQVPSGIIGSTVTLVADDEGWAIGLGDSGTALYHYQKGVWTQYPT